MRKYEGWVRESSGNKSNQEIDQKTMQNIQQYGYSNPEEIEKRLNELAK